MNACGRVFKFEKTEELRVYPHHTTQESPYLVKKNCTPKEPCATLETEKEPEISPPENPQGNPHHREGPREYPHKHKKKIPIRCPSANHLWNRRDRRNVRARSSQAQKRAQPERVKAKAKNGLKSTWPGPKPTPLLQTLAVFIQNYSKCIVIVSMQNTTQNIKNAWQFVNVQSTTHIHKHLTHVKGTNGTLSEKTTSNIRSQWRQDRAILYFNQDEKNISHNAKYVGVENKDLGRLRKQLYNMLQLYSLKLLISLKNAIITRRLHYNLLFEFFVRIV